jgi:TonB family protein
MKILTSLFIALSLSASVIAQDSTKNANYLQKTRTEDLIFDYVERMPMFPGGKDAMVKYIYHNTNYPQNELEAGIEGTAYVNVIIEKDGSIDSVAIRKGVPNAKMLDEEALRVVKAMPNWTPGTQNGKPVRVKMVLPVKYSINKTEQTPDDTLLMVEVMPEFPGGEAAMFKYLQENIVYPKKELELGIEGTVYVGFIVEKDGKISNVVIKRGVPNGKELAVEASRVVKAMPNWKPGMQNGKPVRTQMTVPIKYSLGKRKR